MRTSQKVLLALLLVLLLAAFAGVLRTRDTGTATSPVNEPGASKTAATALVDEQPLRTARALAPLAATPEEQPIAKEALRIGDYDVDLAFAIALRQAEENPPPATPETREILKRLQDAQKTVDAEQQEIASLTKQLAAATGARKEKLEEDLDEAKAQLEPDLDEVEDAKQDLIRAGGDPHARIQQLKEQHEAGQHQPGQAGASPSAAQSQGAVRGGMAGEFTQWMRLRKKEALLLSARGEAQEKVPKLTQQHGELEEHLASERAKAPASRNRSGGAAASPRVSRPAEERAAGRETAKHLSEDRKELAAYDKRISSEQELAEIYGRWGGIASAQTRAALHGLLQTALWLLIVLFVLVGIAGWVDHFFAKRSDDRRRLVTLRTVVRVTTRAASVAVILLFVFGAPTQIVTVIGLAGAGLTVALKDFIVGFFGWFVLMGKNGMSVGDWVEINGVSGEVVEIGMFRTVLLETGNWADAGHPTGRRVTFANGFAIEGHYFNFSTTGQWLWDQLEIVIPVTKNPYPVVDEIRKVVAAMTAENTRQAELEWQRATRSRGMAAIPAEPAINIRPVAMGIEIMVRYITRANERHQLRTKLYHEVIGLLGREGATVQSAGEPAPEGAKTTL
jgi:small-conductance mechanosensitive channel